MFFRKLNECGYEEALLGLSLSFYDHKIPLVDWDYLFPFRYDGALTNARVNSDTSKYFWTDERFTKAQKIGLHLANKLPVLEVDTRDNPDYVRAERKFLRSIVVWGYIQAPRSFWSEFDTYQVGMTKNSSSTMHTLDKRLVTPDDFEVDTNPTVISAFNEALVNYKNPEHPHYKDIARLKANLPEGWLQERQVCTNYEVLRAIINQRSKHRLWYWKYLCEEITKQVNIPELLGIVK